MSKQENNYYENYFQTLNEKEIYQDFTSTDFGLWWKNIDWEGWRVEQKKSIWYLWNR